MEGPPRCWMSPSVAASRPRPSDGSDVSGSELDVPTVCRLDGALDGGSAAPVQYAPSAGVWPTRRRCWWTCAASACSTDQGFGALVGVLRGAHPGVGRVRVCADQPALVRLLRAEGLDRLFPLVSRPDQPAVAARP